MIIDGNLTGSSVSGNNGAYTSISGDVGSPGNMPPISLEEFMLLDITLYPNPASEVVNITTESNAEKTVKVTTLAGKVVSAYSTSEKIIRLDVNNLITGVYVITIEMDNAKASRKLVIK